MAATWGRIGRHLGESLRSTRFSCGKNVLRLGSSIIGQPLRVFIALPAAGACEFKTFQTSCIVRAGHGLIPGSEFCLHNKSFKSYTDEDWKKRLSPEQYHICREKGTEPSWSGKLLDNKQPGIYNCVCCDANLFDSSAKFDSESGWPSFWSAIEHEQTNEQKEVGLPNLSVDQVVDKSHGMVRVEVLCSQCGSHLGHVFSDGPKPTGLRYCINSIALKFKPTVTN